MPGRKRLPPSDDQKIQRNRERARACYWRSVEGYRARARDRAAVIRSTVEGAEVAQQRARDYAKSHGAEAVARVRAWRKANPEKSKAARRAAYARAPWKWLFHGRNRRAKLAGAAGNHSRSEILDRLKEQCGLCAYCLRSMGDDFEVEHVTPISRGGSNDIDNIVLACPGCNNSKNDRTILEFLQFRERGAREVANKCSPSLA